jgi:hypothetical protein
MRWSEEEYAAYLRRGQPPAVTEAAFLAAVLKLARTSGWMAYHTYRSTKSAEGFPDVVAAATASAIRPLGRLLFAELKTETGIVSQAQQAWLSTLQGIESIECYVWRPTDWEEIIRIFRYNL